MYCSLKKLIVCVLFLSLLFSLPAWAVTGIALVHGKGSADLSNAQTAIAYWTNDMIRACSANNAYPYLVAHYDGTQWMWQAADQVASQLYDFINQKKIDDLVVVTHSFGGIVMRWICSNPDYNPRYPTIIKKLRWVNTIAAPAKGSEAADMAGELSGSWLTSWLVDLVGQKNGATINCTTSKMAEFNNTSLFGTPGRPALPKPFHWVSGYGLWNDFCLEDNGLAILSGIVGMPGEDDGCVSEYSSQAVGSKWFRTEANHHHSRRNDYRKIGDAVGKDLAGRWTADSGENLAETNRSGAMIPDNNRNNNAYRSVSTRYIQFVVVTPEKATEQISLSLEKSDHAYVAVWPLHKSERGMDFQISLDTQRTPDMVVKDKGTLEFPVDIDLPMNGKALIIESPKPGMYPLSLSPSARNTTQAYAVVVNTNSDLTLTAYPSQIYAFTHTPVTFFAELREAGNPILNAQVVATIYDEKGEKCSTLTLQDREGNGIYSVSKIVGDEIASKPGSWFIRFSAHGQNSNGNTFQRNTSFYFRHTALSGIIGVPEKESCLWDKDSKSSKFQITVPVSINQAGKYRLTGILYAGDQPMVWACETKTLDTICITSYTLVFDCEHITQDGPFDLRMELFSLDQIAPAGESVQNYKTKASVFPSLREKHRQKNEAMKRQTQS